MQLNQLNLQKSILFEKFVLCDESLVKKSAKIVSTCLFSLIFALDTIVQVVLPVTCKVKNKITLLPPVVNGTSNCRRPRWPGRWYRSYIGFTSRKDQIWPSVSWFFPSLSTFLSFLPDFFLASLNFRLAYVLVRLSLSSLTNCSFHQQTRNLSLSPFDLCPTTALHLPFPCSVLFYLKCFVKSAQEKKLLLFFLSTSALSISKVQCTT